MRCGCWVREDPIAQFRFGRKIRLALAIVWLSTRGQMMISRSAGNVIKTDANYGMEGATLTESNWQ